MAITGAEIKPRRGERPATDIPRTCAQWRALLRAEMRSDALYCSNRNRQEAWLAQQMPAVTKRCCQQCGNAVQVRRRGGLARTGHGMPSYRVQPRMFSRRTQMPEAAEPAAATPAIIAATIIATRIEYSIRELPALWRQRRRNTPSTLHPKGEPPSLKAPPGRGPRRAVRGVPRQQADSKNC